MKRKTIVLPLSQTHELGIHLPDEQWNSFVWQVWA